LSNARAGDGGQATNSSNRRPSGKAALGREKSILLFIRVWRNEKVCTKIFLLHASKGEEG